MTTPTILSTTRGHTKLREFTIKTTGGEVRAIEHEDGTITYPDHDPFCVIYKLGTEHCNCSQSSDPDELPEDDYP